MSKVMHEAVFRKLGVSASYELFDVESGGLKSFIEGAREGFTGLNVTIPHKVSVIDFIDELSEVAELIGAVNTVKFEDGRAFGFNTDGIGFVESLRHEGVGVCGKNVLILGAGGAARAITFQSILEGAFVSLSNREEEKQMAVDLASEACGKTGGSVLVVDMDLESLKSHLAGVDILVNATPLGMHPRTEVSVIDAGIIPEGVVVVDIVYNPVETKLLREAGARGLKTVSGVGMLVHQGAEAERIWLGIEPPLETMYKAVLTALDVRK